MPFQDVRQRRDPAVRSVDASSKSFLGGYDEDLLAQADSLKITRLVQSSKPISE